MIRSYTAGASRWELTETYPVFPYRAQYREDDWSYAARLLEEAGELTMAVRKALVDVQYGRSEDPFGWMHKVC